ncbi:hypothetical protein [Stenotrophomonas rhizophila]|uniref:hypothetical protein n=1 Tax=Stenotrophomonas rhizophila TaxID=216778 RepID=UPI001E4F7290|nr:hypothetical protein [Stenotrophomonas rhizophila]MCC7634233.1 hypothetical protein [Stenotrophomonas rhizophila]MCC7663927.1 hypothetical protein [Stenotrophomonas rhizophila]
MKPDEQTRLLEEWFQFAVEDPLVIDSDCINTEATGNMCSFSQAGRSVPEPGALVAWIQRIAAHRATQLHGHAVTFYYWHDMQARQLRLSLVSRSHGRLPFGCHHVETPDIDSVVRSVVVDDWRNPKYMAREEGCRPDEAVVDMPFFTEEHPLKVGVIPLG